MMLKLLSASLLFGIVTALLAPSVNALPSKVVWVDCGAASGGDGRAQTPYRRIGDAVDAERPAPGTVATHRTIIGVRPGVCGAETFPMRLDYPVWVRGSRVGKVDDLGLPLDDQYEDTLLLGGVVVPFFRITADDVHISGLSLDGRQTNPLANLVVLGAIEATQVSGYDLWNLRIVRAASGIVSRGASGRIRASFIGTVGECLTAYGGTAAAPAEVGFIGNRASDFGSGGVALVPANPLGDGLTAVIRDNEFITSSMNTGLSNPFGVRVNAVLGGPPNVHGKLTASVTGNRFLGSHRYPIIVSGGNVLRAAGGVADTRPYTATVVMDFSGNFIDRAGVTRNAAVITFTNNRATEIPCELNPANVGPACPSVGGGRYWKYAQNAVFDITHDHELDDAWIDHPATDPVDGRVLDNVLIMNGQVVPHETFVVP